MSSNPSYCRPAFGQEASLGSLYDARTDSFLPLGLFNGHPPAEAVSTAYQNSSNTLLSFDDSFKEKFEKMNVDPGLGTSILARMPPLAGTGQYLGHHRESNKVIQGALHYSGSVALQKLNLMAPEARDTMFLQSLQKGKATHVVTEITWGADNIFVAQQRLAAGQDKAFAEEYIQMELMKLYSILETNAPFSESETEVDAGGSLEFTIFSDLLKEEEPLVTDERGALKFIESMPKRLAATNHGSGKPIVYNLMPVGVLSYLLQTTISVTFNQPSQDELGQAIQLFDDWRAAIRRLVDYHEDVAKMSSCLPPDYEDTVGFKLGYALSEEGELPKRLAQALLAARTGGAESQLLRFFLRDAFQGENSPQAFLAVTEEFQERMAFARSVAEKGGKYVNNGSAQKFIASGSEVYIFYFNEEMKIDPEGWEKSKQVFFDLLKNKRSQHANYVVLACDCDLDGTPLTKAYITHYEKGKVVEEDVVEEQSFLSEKCFARYNAGAIDRNKDHPKPRDRKPVRLPCPHPACSGGSVQEWFCSECKDPLEYSDKYMYCYCGRCKFDAFVYQCKGPSHGPGFVPFKDSEALKTNLDNLEAYKELNILILGETGVGKSTFINAFVNYLVHDTLDDAIRDKDFKWVIPCSFSMQYVDKTDPEGKFVQQTIKLGDDTNEHDGSTGDSATQKTTVYRISFGETIVRLIDTPGIGDTRGVEQDQKNMADILSTLGGFSRLHGILILLKPNNARLTLMFRFCVTELLTHLHRDASRNMVFGFTNTRQTNYMPGDTYQPLESLLKKHESAAQIPLSPKTVFCFDSESFRFLATLKQTGVEMDNIDDFRQSWERSVAQTRRMLEYFSGLEPHSVRSTLSLNRARELITQLTKPMADIASSIESTIQINKDNLEELKDIKSRGQKWKQKLHFQKVIIDAVQLERPRTVCAFGSCVDYKDIGTGELRPVYKSFCHDPCYLDDVKQEVIGHSNLYRCWAFGEGTTVNCNVCTHHWQQHMHFWFSQSERTVTEMDQEVVKQLASNESERKVKQTAIDGIKAKIREAEDELRQIRDAAVQFGMFLKHNSITPYNDEMIAYLDELIKQERQTVEHAKTQKIATSKRNQDRLNTLVRSRAEYEKRIEIIEAQIQAGTNTNVLDENGVEDLVNRLYSLKHWGKNLRQIRTVAEAAKNASYREQQFRARYSRRWTSPSPSGGFFSFSGMISSVSNALRSNSLDPRPGGGGGGYNPGMAYGNSPYAGSSTGAYRNPSGGRPPLHAVPPSPRSPPRQNYTHSGATVASPVQYQQAYSVRYAAPAMAYEQSYAAAQVAHRASQVRQETGPPHARPDGSVVDGDYDWVYGASGGGTVRSMLNVGEDPLPRYENEFPRRP